MSRLLTAVVMSLCLVMGAIAAPTSVPRAGAAVVITTAIGTTLEGYLVGSSSACKTVLLLHDRWGMDTLILDLADKLSTQNYTVLAIDLYDGRRAEKEDAEQAAMLTRQIAPEWLDTNLRSGLTYLHTKPGCKTTLMGIGYGGTAAMRAAVIEPTLVTSTVNISGKVPHETEAVRLIAGPVLTVYATQDNEVARFEVDSFTSLRQKLRLAATLTIVEGSPGFMDPRHAAYDEAAATRIWQASIDFLNSTQR
ncbi:MAG: carboxymethylenebutenolidase [Halothiobacillaceae bacterium]|nr:MAG: carboxymethylenebutenolidase [Halothiobacillaceae bacterium]